MKKIPTMLFCTYKDGIYQPRRLAKWVEFYDKWNIDLFVINDGPAIDKSNSYTSVGFSNSLGRLGCAQFPGWWRSFCHSLNIAKNNGYEKIIHCESDAFVFSQDLKYEMLRKWNKGWHSLWAPKYGFPETAFQVINSDQFEKMEILANKMQSQNWVDNTIAENLIPFTNVHREWNGDRFGETPGVPPCPLPDYSAQCQDNWEFEVVCRHVFKISEDVVHDIDDTSISINGWKIISSMYGIRDTDRICEFIDPLKLLMLGQKVYATNSIAKNDPAPGERKKLYIKCVNGLVEKTFEFDEGSEIILEPLKNN